MKMFRVVRCCYLCKGLKGSRMHTSILVSNCCFRFGLTLVITPECEMIFQYSPEGTLPPKAIPEFPKILLLVTFPSLKSHCLPFGASQGTLFKLIIVQILQKTLCQVHLTEESLSSDYLLHAVFFQLSKPIPSFSKQTLILEHKGQVVPVEGFCFRH